MDELEEFKNDIDKIVKDIAEEEINKFQNEETFSEKSNSEDISDKMSLELIENKEVEKEEDEQKNKSEVLKDETINNIDKSCDIVLSEEKSEEETSEVQENTNIVEDPEAQKSSELVDDNLLEDSQEELKVADKENDLIGDSQEVNSAECSEEKQIEDMNENFEDSSQNNNQVEEKEVLPSKTPEESSTDKKETPIGEEESSKLNLSDNPEDIINLIKSLSPEKLLQIKSKVLEISETKEGETSKAVDNQEQQKQSAMTVDVPLPQPPTNKDDDVICLDSDDEAPSPPKVVDQQIEQVSIEPPQASPQIPEKKDTEMQVDKELNFTKEAAKICLKECINPECPRNANDEYIECPLFIMNLYYVTRKLDRNQYICSTCAENAYDIYEQLCTNVSNNIPWTYVKIPKKQELVEIVDSDDEDKVVEKKRKISESEMIEFTEETEETIEEILNEMITHIDIQKQLDHEYKLIEEKSNEHDRKLRDIDDQLKVLEKKSQVMYDELYAINRPKYERRPSIHFDTSIITNNTVANVVNNRERGAIPKQPQQPIPMSHAVQQMPVLSPDFNCFAVRTRVQGGIPQWQPCKVLEEVPSLDLKYRAFKVQFSDMTPNTVCIVPENELSAEKFSEKLEIGARVIARFPRTLSKSKALQSASTIHRWLPGVIGEKLTNYNKRRYLVFCDYGQVRYCLPFDVRAVRKTSENVWEDVHQNLRQFIRDYLSTRKDDMRSRAMLNLNPGAKILVEQGGAWRQAIAQEVDCSLVKVSFPHSKNSEWLYRGSKRLHQIYMQAEKHQASSQRSAVRRDPGISYYTVDDESEDGSSSSSMTSRSTAKKSTAGVQQQQPSTSSSTQQTDKRIILNDDKIYLEEPVHIGQVKHFTPKSTIRPKDYVQHECNPTCLPPLKNDLSTFGPLSKPLLAFWERQVVRQKSQRFIVYRAPCGRRLRNMLEIFNYLRMTKSFLNVDNFDLDYNVHVLALYRIEEKKCGYYHPDCSEGKEKMKIPVVNAFDDQTPPPLKYSANRIPMGGVHINTDPEFMSCCDCTDDCVDKRKCACFQLTIQGAKYLKNKSGSNEYQDDDDISYVWKRLLNNVPTGIYECNSRCKCSNRCLNKVVQQPITVQMQLYRTMKRGWGLKTLHDIPKGTFLCIYAGNLYTEKDANALCQGQDHGDEYFAELDLIEVVEAIKEGYEPGVVYPDSDEEKSSETDSDYDEKNDDNDDKEGDGDFISKARTNEGREIITRSSKRKNNKRKSAEKKTFDEDSEDEIVSMIPSGNTKIPLRKRFGPKERPYIMDAKNCGNIGRYFNHSCEPNLFVQNVFVDTHDLRFPWIAFFTSRHIKASEELTWNYQYEIDSVPSKILICHCGTKSCIGRIL